MEGNRFTVSTVENENKKNGILMGASIISRPLRTSETAGAPAQPDTWLHDAGWRRKRSLAQLTREALPRMENYRNSKRALKRPSLGELHGDHLITEEDGKDQRDTKSPTPAVGIKLGWIQGVLIPCLLNIWGVMLFLRISWVVAQAGIGMSLVIIAISAVVCVITTLSMSAICTNGEVKGGGIYYIISRSLGPEFGASVGIIFAFANAVAASMNTIGFCDSLNDLLKNNGLKIVDNGVNDVRIVGAIALVVMCIICAVGMDWESKAQNFLIAIIVGAMVDFIVGTIMGPKDTEEIAQGFVGFSAATFEENFRPDFRFSEGLNQDFFSVFAIFFPSVTGIQAGANISGDLKDPASAIPKGTLLALLISMLSYALMVLFSGGGALRDASGNVTALLLNGTITNTSALSDCVISNTCKYGLHNSYSVMQLMSAWGPLIYGGCWAATLSTALTNLLSVPRLIQALGVDRIYPGLIFFSKPYGRHGEPYRGYVLTFFVSLVFLLIADLNTIAPLISNFYLTSYALINFCTFHAALVRPLGWRPTFRYFNVWVSLLGFLMCAAIMLLISWVMSLVTFGIFFTLYLIVHYRKPDVNWGSSTQAQMYKTALSSAHSLARTGEHVKNYWPQLLVLAGIPQARPALVDLGSLITKAGSLMIVGDISEKKLSYKERSSRLRTSDEWLRERKVRAFCSEVHGLSFELGARALMQAAGVGRLAPNVLLMGYKADWTTAPVEDLDSYFTVLHTAFENRLAVAILRVAGGLECGAALAEAAGACGGLTATSSGSGDLRVRRGPAQIMHADSDLDIRSSDSQPSSRHNLTNLLTLTTSRSFTISEKESKEKKKDKKATDIHRQIIYKASNGVEISKDQLSLMTIFQRKQEPGSIDVWWLYDDGGLTILLPYIISQRSAWANCKLRIFALANRRHELELEERNMANLLSKFRIDYSSLTMVQDIMEPPQEESKKFFDDLISKFTSETTNEECRISETELLTLAEKTNRQLRLRELLLANSRAARLVVMSLPMPRKGSVSAPLYMAWLEVLSSGLPPMLFVRGNHTSVLTFYSYLYQRWSFAPCITMLIFLLMQKAWAVPPQVIFLQGARLHTSRQAVGRVIRGLDIEPRPIFTQKSPTRRQDVATSTSYQRGSFDSKPSGGGAALVSTTKLEDIESRLTKERSHHGSIHGPIYHAKEIATPELTTYGIKLGWIQGVLIPCLLNIWGVMLFLRIAWIVAQAGIGLSILIILIATLVCVITTLSLCAICTNGSVQGGGVYYLVSRSLGAELGASVGIIFAFANAVAASMNTIGFCESLNDLLKSHGVKVVDNGANDIRIVGAIALLAMCCICAIGMDWASKTQNLLIFIIVLAIFNYIIGACMGPSSELQQAKGFAGLNLMTAKENWQPDFRYSEHKDHDFISIFAIYFPAVTGIQSGANICGDLKNPAKAIPRGTLVALGVSTSTYLAMAALAGAGARRDASGSLQDHHSGTLAQCTPNCPYGLHNDYKIMHIMALWGPFIYGGCWAATLSTALTNLLSVPRLIQALGVDRIYPGLIFFSKPYGRSGEPYRGYVLTFCVSFLFLLIADLNTIAPMITNFYLASYALINFCTFHAGFTRAISWRPSFKYYNTWLSMLGFIFCVIIMILLSWVMALVTVLLFLTLYMLVVYRKPDARWGCSRDASKYHEMVSTLVSLSSRAGHVKEYSPQPLGLCGPPPARRALLDLAALITAGVSFMIVGHVTDKSLLPSDYKKHKQNMEHWLYIHKFRAFYVYLEDMDLETGAKVLMQCTGLGRFSPNVLLVGFKDDWHDGPRDVLLSYVEILRYAFERQLAVCIFRAPRFLEEVPSPSELRVNRRNMQKMHAQFSAMHASSDFQLDKLEREESRENITTPNDQYRDSNPNILKPRAPYKSFIYKPIHIDTTNCIDTWWLYDDGGLTILLSYIITNRAMKDKIPLRIFALPNQNTSVKESQKSIEKLLGTYRINYTQLKMVTGLLEPPKITSWDLFEDLVRPYKSEDNRGCCVTGEELSNQHAKTSRYLRLRELVLDNSSGAEMVVMSLPMAKRGAVSPALYMAWLEILSRDLPPMLFVRGSNNTPVLGV